MPMSVGAAIRTTAALVAGLACAIQQPIASAAPLQFTIMPSNTYGYLTELGDTTITVFLTPSFPGPVFGAHFQCGASVLVSHGEIIVQTILDAGEPSAGPPCQRGVAAVAGVLEPGHWLVTAHLFLPDGTTNDVTYSFDVVPRGNKCNWDPPHNTRQGYLTNKTPEEFRLALANDPDYRAQLGGIAYVSPYYIENVVVFAFPPLDDLVRVEDRLQRSGEFSRFDGSGITCFSPSPDDKRVPAVEYYDARLDHYFFTSDVGEQAAIDAGQVGVEWQRTGKSFPVVLYPGCPNGDRGMQRIYRFAGEPYVGPNSHFFTVSQDECGVVRDRKDWHWQFEGSPFWAIPPTAGVCPDRTVPLYRAYNDGKGGDPNHRYSIDHSVIDAMVAQGWIDEGARMCVPEKL
ncbi:MAG: hypothetical protein GZ089_05570 [Aromatoleum sp.]|nr:hypothetical protein [Aromatoleum sp.]